MQQLSDTMTSTVRIIVGLLLAIGSGFLLLPTGIAVMRNHPKVVSIVLWNTLGFLLFGLGWIVALVLSIGDPPAASVVVNVNPMTGSTSGAGKPFP